MERTKKIAFLFLLLSLTSCNDSTSSSEVSNTETINTNDTRVNYYHLVHMGQSLASGEESLPLISTNDSAYNNLMFSMGTQTWPYDGNRPTPSLRDDENFALVPLKATQRLAEGESIASGYADHLMDTLTRSSVIEPTGSFIFSFAGQGGRMLRELDKRHDDAADRRAGSDRSGGGYYITSIDDVKRAKEKADSLGYNYEVLAVSWMQGESQANGEINRWDPPLEKDMFIETYKEDLINLKEDYNTDIQNITGQSKRVNLFSSQTQAYLPGLAQLQAANEDSEIHMVSPTYFLPSAVNSTYKNVNDPSDEKIYSGYDIHLSADGQRWLGELFAKVVRKVVFENQNWMPLSPKEASLSPDRKNIHIQFFVPTPPLVLDDKFLPNQGGTYGFEVEDNQGNPVGISSVSIIGQDYINIELKEILSSQKSVFVNYGVNNNVGKSLPTIVDAGKNKVCSSRENRQYLKLNDTAQEIVSLANEGKFYVTSGDNKITVDRVCKEGDFLLLRVSNNSRDNSSLGDEFSVGRKVKLSRIYNYGNLRDSDPEQSTYQFSDSYYGTRQFDYYPLWNWGLVFKSLPVNE